MRFLSGRALSLSHTFYDDDNILTVPSVAVTLRLDGATSDAFSGSATDAGGGKWTVSVPAQPQGVYTLTWVGNSVPTVTDVEEIEVVGQVIYTVTEARNSDIDLASTARFPAEDLRRYRDVVEGEFERITGRSFTPRTRTVSELGDGTASLYLGLHDVFALIAVTVDGVAVDLAAERWTVDQAGFLYAPYDLPEGSVVAVTVDYGFRYPPDDIKRAAILRARSLLASENSGIPDRATSFIAAEGGTFTLATPGRAGAETGIPEVDVTLSRYRYKLMGDVLGLS